MRSLLLCVLVALGQTAAPAPPATGVVAGVVMTGLPPAPVPFAEVQMAMGSAGMPGGSYRTETNAEGRFAFTEVRTGIYALLAAKPGFAPGYYDGSGTPANDAIPTIVVADGGRIDNLVVPIVKGGVISGRVLDQFGEPAVAQVSVRRTQASPIRNSSIYVQTPYDMYRTKSGGAYRIYGLAAGDYVVSATTEEEYGPVGTPTGPRTALASGYYRDTINPAQATVVSVASGEERTGIDLALRRVKLASVSGSITAPPDVDLRNLQVRMRTTRPDLVTGNYISVDRQDDGRFAAPGVRPGDYWLTASGRPARTAGAAGSSAPPLYFTALRVTIEERDIEGVLLTLQQAITVSGRVAVDPAPSQAPPDMTQLFVSLVALPGTVTESEGTSPQGRVGADGGFTIASVTPGRYQVMVRTTAATSRARLVSAAGAGSASTIGEIEIGTAAVADLVLTVAISPIR